jgi:hypothetical protein
VHATVLAADEHDVAFAEQARRYPGFARYQSKTERVVPVGALTPTDERGAPTPSEA